MKGEVSPEEWQARVDFAAAYRLVDIYRMTDLIYNHATVWIPGTDCVESLKYVSAPHRMRSVPSDGAASGRTVFTACIRSLACPASSAR